MSVNERERLVWSATLATDDHVYVCVRCREHHTGAVRRLDFGVAIDLAEHEAALDLLVGELRDELARSCRRAQWGAP